MELWQRVIKHEASHHDLTEGKPLQCLSLLNAE